MTDPLCDLPAVEIAARVRAGTLRAEAVLDSTLERIRVVEGRAPSLEAYAPTPEDREKVHAFITLTEERARAAGACGG